MVFFSIGLTSQFAVWCDAVAARLAQRTLGQVVLGQASTPEELALMLVKSEAVHFVVAARHPGYWLRRALVETNRRFILAVDDPRVAWADLVSTGEVDWIQATRFVACCCTSVMQLLG